MDLNKVMLIGRLTRDPELRTTPTGKSVASMAIATGRSWTDQSGNKQEKTEFSNCVLWGKLGEIAGQYLTKGRQVYVEGRLETRDWVGTDGVKRYRTEIIVENMIMLGNRPAGGGAPLAAHLTNSDTKIDSASLPGQSNGLVNSAESGAVEEEIKVEDIPF